MHEVSWLWYRIGRDVREQSLSTRLLCLKTWLLTRIFMSTQSLLESYEGSTSRIEGSRRGEVRDRRRWTRTRMHMPAYERSRTRVRERSRTHQRARAWTCTYKRPPRFFLLHSSRTQSPSNFEHRHYWLPSSYFSSVSTPISSKLQVKIVGMNLQTILMKSTAKTLRIWRISSKFKIGQFGADLA